MSVLDIVASQAVCVLNISPCLPAVWSQSVAAGHPSRKHYIKSNRGAIPPKTCSHNRRKGVFIIFLRNIEKAVSKGFEEQASKDYVLFCFSFSYRHSFDVAWLITRRTAWTSCSWQATPSCCLTFEKPWAAAPPWPLLFPPPPATAVPPSENA